jgi:glycerol-3-phosphate acyltransferase PlsY
MRLLDSAPIFWYFIRFAHPFSHNIRLLVLSIALAGLLGYLIGSIPTAYLLVRVARRTDIRGAGSGNVGALNSLQVTGSPVIGAVVLLVDVAKGVAAVLAARWVGGGDFATAALAGVAAVFGHNYPVWLGLKGGRGLATAAGVFAIIAWPVIAGWILCWLPAYAFLRRVNPASAVASTALMIVALAAPHHSLSALLPATVAPGQLVLLVVAMMLVILSRLIEPFDRFLEERKQTRKGGPGA